MAAGQAPFVLSVPVRDHQFTVMKYSDTRREGVVAMSRRKRAKMYVLSVLRDMRSD